MKEEKSLRSAVDTWLKNVPLSDDPEWTMMSKLLMAAADSLDAQYVGSVASEFRKLSTHMAEYSKGAGGDTLDAILRRADV